MAPKTHFRPQKGPFFRVFTFLATLIRGESLISKRTVSLLGRVWAGPMWIWLKKLAKRNRPGINLSSPLHMWGSANEQYRNGCEGFKHQQSGKRMKTTSIKEHSLFERELEREKVLRKQWGRRAKRLHTKKKHSWKKGGSVPPFPQGDILWPRVELANNDDINTT